MRTEKEIRAKIIEIAKKHDAFDGRIPLLGKAPSWFLEGLDNEISLLKWVLNEEE